MRALGRGAREERGLLCREGARMATSLRMARADVKLHGAGAERATRAFAGMARPATRPASARHSSRARRSRDPSVTPRQLDRQLIAGRGRSSWLEAGCDVHGARVVSLSGCSSPTSSSSCLATGTRGRTTKTGHDCCASIGRSITRLRVSSGPPSPTSISSSIVGAAVSIATVIVCRSLLRL